MFTITEVKTTAENQAFNINQSQSKQNITEQCSSGILQKWHFTADINPLKRLRVPGHNLWTTENLYSTAF